MSEIVTAATLALFVGYCMGIATAVMFLVLYRLEDNDD